MEETMIEAELQNEEFAEQELCVEEMPQEETEEISGEAAEGADDTAAEKTVPLAALHSEREKLREIKRQYAQSREVLDKILKGAGAASIDELKEKMEAAEYRAALKSGMSPETAKLFVRQQNEMRELRDMRLSAVYADEISRLRQHPFYSDIDAVSEQVIGFAREKKISAKEAYNALFADSRVDALKSMAIKMGEETARQKQSKRIAALSSEGNAAGTRGADLSAEEAWAAKTAGMSPEEYLKFKKTRI